MQSNGNGTETKNINKFFKMLKAADKLVWESKRSEICIIKRRTQMATYLITATQIGWKDDLFAKSCKGNRRGFSFNMKGSAFRNRLDQLVVNFVQKTFSYSNLEKNVTFLDKWALVIFKPWMICWQNWLKKKMIMQIRKKIIRKPFADHPNPEIWKRN